MIKLKHILNEDEVEDNFGKVAFGSDPDIAHFQGKKVEKNTDYETELLSILSQWVQGGWDNTEDILWKKYPIIKKAANVFPQIFKPETPNGTNLYRGVSNINPKLEKQLLQTNPSDWIEDGDWWQYTNPVEYTPRKSIQSWSSERDVAEGFAFEYMPGAMLITKQNNEFFFNQKFLSLVYSKEQGTEMDEHEVLHFGKTFTEEIYILLSYQLFKNLFKNN